MENINPLHLNYAIPSIINQFDRPLLIAFWSRSTVYRVMRFCYSLDLDTQIVFLPYDRFSEMLGDRENVFLYLPFKDDHEKVLEAETGFELKTVYHQPIHWLFQVTSFPENL